MLQFQDGTPIGWERGKPVIIVLEQKGRHKLIKETRDLTEDEMGEYLYVVLSNAFYSRFSTAIAEVLSVCPANQREALKAHLQDQCWVYGASCEKKLAELDAANQTRTSAG